MTVCIAARSWSTVFLISDRMITSGDIQFEPPAEKIRFLTSSIAVMASGDSAFHNEIMKGVQQEVNSRVINEPHNWWLVKDVVDLYIKHRNNAKLSRSEAAILAPLGLDRNSFIANQKIMDAEIVSRISSDLINFEVPDVSVIIAGVDQFMGEGVTNTHIYSIFNNYISCDDAIGFRAIGSGSRHAESHMMLAGHSWNSDVHVVALAAYSAKRNAEIAPGVGNQTDMFILGPDLGSHDRIRNDILEKLEVEYKKIKAKQAKAILAAEKELRRYVAITSPSATSQADKPTPEEKSPELPISAEAKPVEAAGTEIAG